MKNQRGVASLVVIITIVAVAIVVGYFAFRRLDSTPTVEENNTKVLSHITPREMAKESGIFFQFDYPEGIEIIEGGHKILRGPGGFPNPYLLIQRPGNTNKDEAITLDGPGYPGGSGIEVKERTCANYANPCEKIGNSEYLLITKSKNSDIQSAFDLIFSTIEIKPYGNYTDEKDPVDSDSNDGSGFISGLILDQSTKQPIKDVEITIKTRMVIIKDDGTPILVGIDEAERAASLIGTTKTDSEGRYSVKVPLGRDKTNWAGELNGYNIFLVYVKKQDYENISRGMVSVKDGQTLRLDFDLSLDYPKG